MSVYKEGQHQCRHPSLSNLNPEARVGLKFPANARPAGQQDGYPLMVRL